MPEIVILGSGISGFGAAYRLHREGLRPVIFEKDPHPGGRAASYRFENGFLFDDGPHVSFTEDPRIRDLLARSVEERYEDVEARINNYWKGHWVKHPAQCNLYGLPPGLVVNILRDFIRRPSGGNGPVRNYEEWLIASYGEAFAGMFPMEYTLKYHTTEARNLTTDWMGPRLYRPKLEEMLLGALSPDTPNVHYVPRFRYPSEGGFVSYLDLFRKMADVRLNREMVHLDPFSRELRFADGSGVRYEKVISSIPLPELIPRIAGTPADVLESARRLACSSCALVNLGVGRENLSNAHITYFYDRDIVFSRLSFPHMMSPRNVRPGNGSIQAEIYFSKKYKPFSGSPGDLVGPVIAGLLKCGLLREEDKILFRHAMVIPYANIIFDRDRAGALAAVHGYLEDIGVQTCGRYGEWGYLWTDDSFKSGEQAAQRILDGR